MAIFDADQAVNNKQLQELEILAGKVKVEKQKSDEIIASQGDITVHLIGKFLITSGGIFDGIIQSIEVEKGDLPDWDISGLFIKAPRFLDRIENGKLKHVVKDIFKDKDQIDGSHFDDKLLGGKGDDKIMGWKGDDIIAGQKGRDTLTGYSGQDSFVFGEKLNYRHADVITDFKPGRDQIWLKKSVFSELSKGELDADAFVMGHGAEDKEDRIIVRSNGKTFYDPDGTGPKDKSKFVTLDHLHNDLTHHDFLVI